MRTRSYIQLLPLVAAIMFTTIFGAKIYGQGPQLILHYNFEDGSVNDLSGYDEDADGVLVGQGSIVSSGDPNRGLVLDTGQLGFGAEVDAVRKMDFRTSFTLQAWFKTAGSSDVFRLIAGRGGSGPRIFNHWGLGGLGTAQLYNTEFGIFDGFTPVEIVSPTGFVDGSTWHHILVTWNSETRMLYGYYDGFDGGDPEDPALTPVETLGDVLIAHGDTPFAIGGFTQQGGTALSNAQIDDVAFWQGYSPPNVAAGLFDGSITIEDAASMMELPTQSADFDADDDVDGNDFLIWQRNFGLDDIETLAVTLADGDANGDLRVDGRDLVVWQAEYGTAAESAISSEVVPEPTSSFAILSAGVLALMQRRRRTRWEKAAKAPNFFRQG